MNKQMWDTKIQKEEDELLKDLIGGLQRYDEMYGRPVMLHEILGVTWSHYRNHYLMPLGLPKTHWERLKIEGRIPAKARWDIYI